MKKIYFIRHGESQGYTDKFVQKPDTPLSEKGIKQSKQIANKLDDLDFKILISSPWKRTLQTAEFISKKTDVKIIENELFIERKRPSRQYGLDVDSDLNKQIDNDFAKALIDGEKFEDAESFEEVKIRTLEILKFIDGLPEENIVIVTHGTILRFISGLILLGEENFTLENAFRITKVLKKTNTGVSVFQKEDIWRIYSWNDFSHFDD